jgi:hypothetical protein
MVVVPSVTNGGHYFFCWDCCFPFPHIEIVICVLLIKKSLPSLPLPFLATVAPIWYG